MILAAGEGRRMRPLTLTTPKPLLKVAGRPLLEHHLLALKAAGCREVVVNAAYLGQQIVEFCGDGSRWGLSVVTTLEPEPLETAGGIVNALAHLGDAPFLLVNGDVFCDFPFGRLLRQTPHVAGAHLVLVANPAHNTQGDFGFVAPTPSDAPAQQGELNQQTEPASSAVAATNSACLQRASEPSAQVGSDLTLAEDAAGATYTYSGIGVYDPAMFATITPGRRALKPLFDQAIEGNRLSGEYWPGNWCDVGTPERLQELNRQHVL